MQIDVVECRAMQPFRLWLRFKDRTEGIADVSQIPRRGLFSAWEDPAYFARVAVDAESGTVCWPNGADLDPYVLYSKVTGKPLPGAAGQAKAVG